MCTRTLHYSEQNLRVFSINSINSSGDHRSQVISLFYYYKNSINSLSSAIRAENIKPNEYKNLI